MRLPKPTKKAAAVIAGLFSCVALIMHSGRTDSCAHSGAKIHTGLASSCMHSIFSRTCHMQ